MNEAARPALVDDLPVLGELHRLATEELREQRGGALWARQTGRDAPLVLDLADPGSGAWIGAIDDEPVGYALAHVEPIDGGTLAVLTDVFVLPGARGVGVGEALLDAAMAWAEAQGCAGIDSIALPGMRESKNFFETAGMVARAIAVHRAFDR